MWRASNLNDQQDDQVDKLKSISLSMLQSVSASVKKWASPALVGMH